MQPEPQTPAGLPLPDALSLEHSAKVSDYIRARIDASGGMIGLAEYMQHALYAPGLGYYTAGNTKFGRNGDFVTAPEISPIFGRVLASQCSPVLRSLSGDILEVGAGSGSLAVAVLRRLQETGCLPASYKILEVSPELTARQQKLIDEEIPGLASLVQWVDALPRGFRGAVIANEVLDALPVERFVRVPDDVLQICVGFDDNGFIYCTRPAQKRLRNAVLEIEQQFGTQFADGYKSEVSLGLHGWIGDLLAALEEGVVLLFDYGVARHEYYAPDRQKGWLRCHFRHHAHEEPMIYPGIQDITSWVDFSAVAEAACACGAEIAGFVTQALFLMNSGLENELADFVSLAVPDQLELSRQIKLLTLPGEMGESFKCMGLSKGNVPMPDAFSFGDRTHTL